MSRRFRLSLLSAAALVALAACSIGEAPSMVGSFTVPANQPPTTIPLIVEGDQILLEVEAVGPKGSRKLLANLNMGRPDSGWMDHVYQEIGHVSRTPVRFNIGGIPIEVTPGHSSDLADKAYPDRQVGFFFFPQT